MLSLEGKERKTNKKKKVRNMNIEPWTRGPFVRRADND